MHELLQSLQITVITAAAILHMRKLRLREARCLALGQKGWLVAEPNSQATSVCPDSQI